MIHRAGNIPPGNTKAFWGAIEKKRLLKVKGGRKKKLLAAKNALFQARSSF